MLSMTAMTSLISRELASIWRTWVTASCISAAPDSAASRTRDDTLWAESARCTAVCMLSPNCCTWLQA